jgi:hypothetical protein
MRPTIRTITLGIGAPHPLDEVTVRGAAEFLAGARAAAEGAGYTTQTTRFATRPLLEDMAAASDDEIATYAGGLQSLCDTYEIGYCSLGPAPATDPAFPLKRIALLPRLIAPHAALSATVQLATVEAGVRYEAALPTAEAMRSLAEQSSGEANFRFAALACCEPGGPFFPQAYQRGEEWTVTVGLQSAAVVRDAIETLASERGPGPVTLAGLTTHVRGALQAAAAPVVALVRQVAESAGYRFGGIDLSPAPMGDESIADAIEAAGFGLFGEPGTLAICAALTAAIRSTDLPTCGYCGLMLPVLEDETIGERCAEGGVTVTSLLAYSAVCGTGLDTVPLAGDTSPERLAALLLDVAALAERLRKPLSARLFLVPGGVAGDMTNFASPYLTNTRILGV